MVLWFSEVKSYKIECSKLPLSRCWNTETKIEDNCQECFVLNAEISKGNDIVSISPLFENGRLHDVIFKNGRISYLPKIEIGDKKEGFKHCVLLHTNTKVINAEFFGDEAQNITSFKSMRNSLTIEENSFINTNLGVQLSLMGILLRSLQRHSWG